MYRLDSINLFPMPYIDLSYTAFYYSQSRLTLICSWYYHRTASPNFQIWCSKWSDQHVSYADLSRIAMDAPSRRQTLTSFTHTMSRKETSSIPLRHHKQIPKPHKKKTSSTDYGGLPPSEADLGCRRLGSILAWNLEHAWCVFYFWLRFQVIEYSNLTCICQNT